MVLSVSDICCCPVCVVAWLHLQPWSAVIVDCAMLGPSARSRLGCWLVFVSSPPRTVSTQNSVTLSGHSVGFVPLGWSLQSWGFRSPRRLESPAHSVTLVPPLRILHSLILVASSAPSHSLGIDSKVFLPSDCPSSVSGVPSMAPTFPCGPGVCGIDLETIPANGRYTPCAASPAAVSWCPQQIRPHPPVLPRPP